MLRTTGGPHDRNDARLQPGTARNVRERRTGDRDHAPRMARRSGTAHRQYQQSRHAAPATLVFTSSDSRKLCISHEFLEYETAVIATPSPLARSVSPATVIDASDAFDIPDQRMHDASRFPLVRLRRRAVQPGYAFGWGTEMQRLLSLKTPFVIVSDHDADETADDTRLRTAWLRSHRETLALFCRGFIVIEPRIEARASTREAVRVAMQGSGVRMVVVSSMRVAGELAPVLLKHSASNLETPRPTDKPRLQMP
jgi:hypothetical protein